MEINSVTGVFATAEQGVLRFECNITDDAGVIDDVDHIYRPSDPYGLSPLIKEWLVLNPNTPIVPYTPRTLTSEEIRAAMPALTARQFRLGLVAGGFTPNQVTQTIDAMPDGVAKETAKIEWEYATTFSRKHPLIAQVSAVLGLTAEQVDNMWTSAQAL